MHHTDLDKKVAHLESLYDHLTTEMDHMNELLKAVGFPDGLQTVKAVAQEILENREEEDS